MFTPKEREGKAMSDFLEIKSMNKKGQQRIIAEIEKRIKQKIKDGVFTAKEIREIEEMELRPLPDILDVQSVYESLMDKKGLGEE